MATDPNSLFTIDGIVLDSSGTAVADARVIAADIIDEAQPRPRTLVSAMADKFGRFSLVLSAEDVLRLFRSGEDDERGRPSRPMASQGRTLALVAYLRGSVVGQLDLAVTLDGLADGYEVELIASLSGEALSMGRGQFQATGTVRDSSGRPLAAVNVEVIQLRLRDEVVLASGQSGSDGSFRLSYDSSAHLSSGATALAVAVRALELQGNGGLLELVRTNRICPARATIDVDLVLPSTQAEGSEIERIAAAIDVRREGLPWRELTDDDIELIACETGVPLAQVTSYVVAARLAEATPLPVEALYGLGRRGMTMSVAAIGALPSGVVERELVAAATQGLVPSWSDVTATASQVSSVMGTRAAADDAEAPLGQLLATTGLPPSVRQDFLVGYVGRSGTVESFWNDFTASHTVQEVAQTRFSLTTGALTHGHLPLVAELEQRRQAGEFSSARDLAGLTRTQWRDLVESTAAPEDYPGEDAQERAQLYAAALARATEEAFPTASLVKRVADGGHWSLAASYIDEHPSLDFRSTNARKFLADHPPAGLTAEQQQTLQTELSQAQRLFMVAPRFDRDAVASVLLDAGVHSAHQIVEMGPSAFVERHGAALGSAAIATVVYDNAHHVTSTLSVLAMKHGQPFLPASIPAVGDIAVDPGDAPPDLEHLLGPMDFCACAHCRSVLSPASYLVDLLHFLEQRPALAGDGGDSAVEPFAALTERRPDLLHTLLDCANTNTPLPAIDLVNEILERQVAGEPVVTWPQTTRTAAQLRAQPEHRLDGAYEIVRDAVYPLSLPFDLARAEADTFLEHLGISRVELLDAGGTPSAELDNAVATARLGLDPVAAQIIAQDYPGTAPTLASLWGLSGPSWSATLEDVPSFIERAGLRYEQLQQLLATSYASNSSVEISFENPCQLNGATIDGLTDSVLSRMLRFVRLWRALGWSMAELDTALANLGSAGDDPLDRAFLRALSRAIALGESLQAVPRRQWLVWFGNLATTPAYGEAQSQYEEVFVGHTAAGEGHVLQPESLAGSITDVAPQVAAALSVTEEELLMLLSLDEARSTATVANLSWLFRWASLTRALELPVRDAVALARLSGTMPFGVVGAAALPELETFVAHARVLARARVSVPEVDALLRHRGPGSAGMSEPALASIMVELVRGLQTIERELAAAIDPSRSILTVLREQLGRVVPIDVADELVAMVESVPDTTPPTFESLPVSAEVFLSEDTWNSLQEAPDDGEPMANLEHRAGIVLGELTEHLRVSLGRGVVVHKLAAALEQSAGAIEALLDTDDGTLAVESSAPWIDRFVGAGLADAIDFSTQSEALTDSRLAAHLQNGTGGFPSFAAPLEALRWLAKSVSLVDQLGLGDDDLRWLLREGANHGLLTPADLPTDSSTDVAGGVPARWFQWQRLVRFADFARTHTAGLAGLRTVFDTDSDEDLRAALAAATQWEEPELDATDSTIEAIANHLGVDGSELRTVEGLESIARVRDVAQRLGVTAVRAMSWAAATPTTAIARDVQAAAQAKVPSEAWLRAVGPLRDGLRIRQRDALVAHMLANDPDLTTPEDLFGRLLVDVEVSPCVLTSRIKQAISSTQTFVQRVLLSKEAGVNLSTAAITEWQWMSRYRLWEANRKIFLWPENWLEPELRDDKTELFSAFQSALLDGELNGDVAKAAVSTYLSGLAQIAQLHVAGMVHEREPAEAGAVAVDKLHVFGRTKVKPYRYFHRVWVDQSEWTPWEELPFVINAESVLPAISRERLVLAWVTVQERSKDESATPPLEYHELRLSWSVRDHRGWGPVRTASKTTSDKGVSLDAVEQDSLASGIKFIRAGSESEFFYRVHTKDNGALIIAPGFPNQHHLCFPAYFEFHDIDDEPIVVATRQRDRVRNDDEENDLARPVRTIPRQQWYVLDGSSLTDGEQPALQLPVRSIWSGEVGLQKLFDAPRPFTLSTTTQYEAFSAESPMIYQDSWRSLLITPRPPWLQATPWEDDSGPTLEGLGGLSHASFVSGNVQVEDIAGGPPQTTDDPGGTTTFELGTVTTTAPTPLESWEQWGFDVEVFDHPLARRLVDLVRRHGVEALYRPPTEGPWATFSRQLVRQTRNELYGLGEDGNTARGSVIDELDFRAGGSYSVYNWELFFHVPMLVALRLMEDRQYEQAREWMHYVFDPTAGGTAPTPSRYWRVKPLFESTVTDVNEQLEALHYDGEDSSKLRLRDDTRDQIARWRRDPFRPHSLARLRNSAYQRWVVMRYLDNLIEWGDHLFTQDTMESNNEALQLYVLAAELLGPRPVMLPERDAAAMSYIDVQGAFDDFSNFMAQAENAVATATLDVKGTAALAQLPSGQLSTTPLHGAYNKKTLSRASSGSKIPVSLAKLVGPVYAAPEGASGSEAPVLYFCVPHNQALMRYWDVVADRLFKLRHCLNIEGTERQLPLFAPPIDPGLLAKAVASGMDVSAALSDVGAPRPHYRFGTMMSLAKELAAEVRGFGESLADALRSADAESLAELRAGQEADVLATIRQIREQRIEQSQQEIVSLQRSKSAVQQRRDYYASLPGRHQGGSFSAGMGLAGYSRNEQKQLDGLASAKAHQAKASTFDATSAALAAIPQFGAGSSGLGPHITTGFGGQQLAAPFRIASIRASLGAQGSQIDAAIAGIQGGHQRRADDWAFQVEQAEAELERIEQDIIAAQLRVDIAKRELAAHDAEVTNAQRVDAYLRDRYTNSELFRWLSSEISRSYFQAYQLAFEIAKQAQRCYQHELGLPQSSFIEFGYWDNRRKGLLAGARLLHDLRRMETSYLANNRREYELTKRVSLARIDPFALLRLRTEGSCDIHLPEALFELEHPSHYMRRIRSVRLSVIGNTGPYDTVGATLTLTRSEVRTLAGNYADTEQPIVETGGATQSIATSTGVSDAGLFEANLRDERYLPFEGRGAVSQWSLSLPKALRTFDYQGIADVVLELQYTAREGGHTFATQVEGADGADLRDRLDSLGLGSADYGMGRMWSLSAAQRFGDEWAAMRQPEAGQPHTLALSLEGQHYPHPLAGGTLRVDDLFVLAVGDGVETGTAVTVNSPSGAVPMTELTEDLSLPGLRISQRVPLDPANPSPLQAPAIGAWTITLDGVADPTAFRDLIVVVRYTEGG